VVQPSLKGRDRGASFVGWYPCDAREEFLRSEIAKLSKERVPEGVAADFVETWEDPTPWSKDFARHGYRYERHDSNHDPLRLAAEAMAHDQLYKSTINVSLAVRKALRRYLGIEPAASSHELGQRFLVSNHIRQRRRFCRTKCG
jgi:hypothetical protein